MCKAPELSAASSAPDGKQLPRFTRADIASKRHDLVIIEDEVYDASSFRWAHPGGALFVSVFGGRDGTLAFQSYHMREFPKQKMLKYLVGTLAASETVVKADPLHLDLSKKIKAAMPKGSFAPTSQIVKASMIFAAAVALEAYLLMTSRTWFGSVALGLLFALIGLNVQHDANHGAMFKNGTVNAFAGLAQSWIGGSQLMWVQEHVVLHHLHTGDVDMDPDAQLAPALRGHGDAPWYPWMRLQHLYVFAAELGYGVVPLFVAFAEVFAMRHKFEKKFALSKLSWPWAVQSTLMHLLFYGRMFVVPALVAKAAGKSVFVELAQVASTVAVGGGYLAFFFFLSHNFDGVHFVKGAEAAGHATYDKGSGFLRQQAASSSNVGGAKLCFVNGGLNYQIEHHLFPRVAHSHYPAIAPIVKQFCHERKIPYAHFDTVGENIVSVMSYLRKTGDPLYLFKHD
ncbi:fatty acid desaturase-domain-containing protein [Pelagophyceae sp. CCMP2097]|nr:fatty acid desaturase-domain-containing protein [Pelagophyceae sp. CCMP2097]